MADCHRIRLRSGGVYRVLHEGIAIGHRVAATSARFTDLAHSLGVGSWPLGAVGVPPGRSCAPGQRRVRDAVVEQAVGSGVADADADADEEPCDELPISGSAVDPEAEAMSTWTSLGSCCAGSWIG